MWRPSVKRRSLVRNPWRPAADVDDVHEATSARQLIGTLTTTPGFGHRCVTPAAGCSGTHFSQLQFPLHVSASSTTGELVGVGSAASHLPPLVGSLARAALTALPNGTQTANVSGAAGPALPPRSLAWAPHLQTSRWQGFMPWVSAPGQGGAPAAAVFRSSSAPHAQWANFATAGIPAGARTARRRRP